MWIRKTDLEIKNLVAQKEIEKKSLRRPFMFGTIFGLLFMVVQYFGFRGDVRGYYVFSSEVGFSWKTVSLGIFGFTMFFLIALYRQRKGLSFLNDRSYFLCSRCQEPADFSPENKCRCGGKLEPSEYFSWEEN